MAGKACHAGGTLEQQLCLLEGFFDAAPRKQVLRPLLASKFASVTVSRHSKSFAKKLLSGFQLTDQLVTHGQQREVVGTMPVVLRRNVLGPIVGFFQVVGFAKL